jgi:PRTRC genetic system ThiF family protein
MKPLTIEKTYQVLLPQTAELHLLLVGVGGTGSALASSLGRLLYHAKQKGIEVKLTLIDPDPVELKNVAGRQYFCVAEQGANKAICLAQRLNLALGLDITAVPHPFTADFGRQWAGYGLQHAAHLLIGCVDNHLARRELAQTVARYGGRLYALDCGNARSNGQVLLGNLVDLQKVKVDELGLCSGLPSPYIQEPGLLEPDPEEAPLSCAELTLREEQSLCINQAVAAVAFQYVYDFTLKRCLKQYATYLSLEPPAASSRLLTPSELERMKQMP